MKLKTIAISLISPITVVNALASGLIAGDHHWINYGTTSDGTRLYVQPGSWSKNGRFRTYLDKAITKDGESFFVKQVADCDEWRYRPTNTEVGDFKWRYITPGTLGDNAQSIICKN